MIMKEFNQKDYIKEWKKDNYKQFKVELKKEEKEELTELLKDNDLSGSDFVRLAMISLKNGTLKKEDKQ